MSAPGPHGKLYKPDIGQPKNILRETFGYKEAQAPKPQAKKQLLTVTIEISEGNSETILVNEGDQPSLLAFDFINKHRLDPRLVPILEN